jgi:hypothetical protein
MFNFQPAKQFKETGSILDSKDQADVLKKSCTKLVPDVIHP